jgi:uncharacterized protein (DUF305 family)
MNHRLLGPSACALALLLAGCGGDSDETSALVKSGAALEAKVGEPGKNSAMPGADDPDYKAFVAATDKAMTALGTDAMPADGLDSFQKLCGPAARITVGYLSAGTGGVAEGEAKAAAMNANALKYMDQVFTPLLYSAHCTAVHMPAVEKAAEEKPDEKMKAAMRQVQGGAFGQAMGLLQIAGDASLDAARHKRALDLIVGDSGNFAIALNQSQRQQVAQLADAVAQANAAAKGQMDQVKAAVAKAPCGKLCGV